VRGAALAGSGALLLVAAAVPCTPGAPLPVGDGFDVPLRNWVHVPAAVLVFYVWPMAAHGWTRRLLAANLVALVPLTWIVPHGRAVAVLQRTMVGLAATALATWTPSQEGRG
jgi:hypothetical protein